MRRKVESGGLWRLRQCKWTAGNRTATDDAGNGNNRRNEQDDGDEVRKSRGDLHPAMRCFTHYGPRLLVTGLFVLLLACPAIGAEEKARTVTLENRHISSVWSSRGGALHSATLLQYDAAYKVNGKRPPLTLLREIEQGTCSMVVERVRVQPAGGEAQVHELADAVYEVAAGEKVGEVVFTRQLSGGLVLRKSVVLPEDRWHFEVVVSFENTSEKAVEVSYSLRTAAGIEPENLPPNRVGPVWGVAGKDEVEVARRWAKDVIDQPIEIEGADLRWAGLRNRYFVAIALRGEEAEIGTATARLVVDTDMLQGRGRWAPAIAGEALADPADRKRLSRSNATVVFESPKLHVPAGGTEADDFRLLLAPKRADVLKQYGQELDELIRFRLFKSISRLMLWALQTIHRVIPNYGLCIIVLTLIIRMLLHPLSRRNEISMARTRQLQPEMERLRDKYGDDKKRLGAEQWALYKKYGIHPLSGCWSIFIQLPIFLGLLGALRAAVQLRQAPFLWIEDLSRPDVLFRLPFRIPLLDTNALRLMPLLYITLSLVSGLVQHKPDDPKARQQQQMMTFFPVAIALILYNLPSGVMLYWVISHFLGAIEHWRVRKHVENVKLEPVKAEEKSEKRRSLLGRLLDEQAKKIRRRD